MEADCKSAGSAYGGSNPSLPIRRHSSEVEHFIGNEEVLSSNLSGGSRKFSSVGRVHD
jgi:hypothetical protein